MLPLTVVVPAYNEGASLGETLLSLQAQTVGIAQIVVIDDCSTDTTAEVAGAHGVTVLRPPANTGSKAGAQNYALQFVDTEWVLAIDADTTLAPDAIERLVPALEEDNVGAACGFVLPRTVETLWERGRYCEYIVAFSFYKQIQDYYTKPLIASGCFSMYRTDILKELGGWSTRTLAEDMDLTWTMYERGYAVRFVPEAVSYPLEPHNYHFMAKQLKRWSHGYVQNLMVHWRDLVRVPYLRVAVGVQMWDAVVASVLYLLVLPILALFISPWLLLGYVIDVPVVLVPALYGAVPRGEAGRALASIPAFFVLRTVNAVFFLRALWAELVTGRTFRVYEKGH